MEHAHDIHTIRYDAAQRRLWILGQRCHHGAVGVLLTAAAGAWIGAKRIVAPTRSQLAEAHAASRAIVIASFGGILMLHDRKDHTIWFERGPGSQL